MMANIPLLIVSLLQELTKALLEAQIPASTLIQIPKDH